jgi:LL-diaminopimelate aminotransferase
MRFAQRLQARENVPWYAIEKLIRAKKAEGVRVISLGAGNPDLPISSNVVKALRQAALDPAYHRYQANLGTDLHRAIASWYHRRYGVELDPDTQVYPLNGSQAGISSLGLLVIEPGSVALVTDPAYDHYASTTRFAGGEVHYLPVREENGYLPDLSTVPAEVLARTRLLWLNYPNNPTGAIAPLSFFEDVVAFAREHDILVCHDNAYSDITYDGYVAPSFLEADGAIEVGIELNSLSKTFSMAGWRVGMAVGNASVLSALFQVHQCTIVNLAAPVRAAAVEALTSDPGWMVERNQIYQERRDIMVEGLRAVGLETPCPKATLYVWARLPEGQQDSHAFSMRVLDQTGVLILPGIFFGQGGEGYLRASLTVPTEELCEAMERLQALK